MTELKLIGLTLVGLNLMVPPGPAWAEARLSSGYNIKLYGEYGFDSAMAELERRGISCDQYRARLDRWVKTGDWPEGEEDEA